MNSEHLFKIALGIENPWEVVGVSFKDREGESAKELHIDIDFKRGSKFPEESGNLCGVYDTKQKTWRHLNFFQHACYLHCRVPRIECSDGQIKLVEVPWSRPGSGFTLLFEAYAMALIENEMPVNKVGKLLDEDAHRIWTIFNHWIGKAYAADAPRVPKKLGMDETSSKKGHEYVTVAVDMDERRVIHVTEGKDIKAVAAIKVIFTRFSGVLVKQLCRSIAQTVRESNTLMSNVNVHDYKKFQCIQKSRAELLLVS